MVSTGMVDYLFIALWGLTNSIICGCCLIALVSHLADLSLAAKAFLAMVVVGTVTRAYGFWTGVKGVSNFWDVLFMVGCAGMSVRLAIRGIKSMLVKEPEVVQ